MDDMPFPAVTICSNYYNLGAAYVVILKNVDLQASERKVQAKLATLEIWLKVGKNIIQFSTYVFNSSHNFRATEKFIK